MNDQELLELLRNNPNRAIHILLELYGGAVSTICGNFLYDCGKEDVEEAIADTFANFWKKSKSFVLNDKYTLKSYIYAIARNVSRDMRRKLKRKDIYSLDELSLELPADFSVEQKLEQKEMEAILHTCLENMKEPDKSVFLYRYFYGFKINDIAKIMNLPEKKVENILYHGKGRLRRELQERGISHV